MPGGGSFPPVRFCPAAAPGVSSALPAQRKVSLPGFSSSARWVPCARFFFFCPAGVPFLPVRFCPAAPGFANKKRQSGVNCLFLYADSAEHGLFFGLTPTHRLNPFHARHFLAPGFPQFTKSGFSYTRRLPMPGFSPYAKRKIGPAFSKSGKKYACHVSLEGDELVGWRRAV